MDKRLYHLKKKLSENLGRSWSVGDMADVAEMSVPNLHRLFRDQNDGSTPGTALHALRLKTARDMLVDPCCFLLIKEIGFRIGLKSESHFTRDFKAKYGMTPTKYRNHQAEIHQLLPANGQE